MWRSRFSDEWRGGGIITGERELAEGETSNEIGSGSGGAKNPTLRTLGSMTARGARRASMTEKVVRSCLGLIMFGGYHVGVARKKKEKKKKKQRKEGFLFFSFVFSENFFERDLMLEKKVEAGKKLKEKNKRRKNGKLFVVFPTWVSRWTLESHSSSLIWVSLLSLFFFSKKANAKWR